MKVWIIWIFLKEKMIRDREDQTFMGLAQGRGDQKLTYEEYRDIVYKECKKDAITQTYPEEFERLFKRLEENGYLREEQERGIPPLGIVGGICLMV